MSIRTTYTIDVEPDLHDHQYKGITEGLKKFEKICDKHKIKPILFVTADCIKKYPEIFKRLEKKGWEISLHGFTHKRFDDIPYKEKEDEIKQSLTYWKKYLNSKPKGFRAPQHSIDEDTLDLLEKYGFEYDSSQTPLNFLQLLFFPHKFPLWIKSFLTPRNPYKIRKNLYEYPPSALKIPFVSLTVRVLPKPFLRAYIALIKAFHTHPMFYAHSWDFIKLPESRIDRTFPYTKLLDKLDYIISLENENP
ncbi:MAG: polysaccharide deacetylase family protein [Nanoarchaeota archaeon]|nr:polysaccharide deacetylase family protein [Nanoarchaeota archaeon]